jgi:hypothetical protein
MHKKSADSSGTGTDVNEGKYPGQADPAANGPLSLVRHFFVTFQLSLTNEAP